jgi:hypothetical protein
MDSFGGGVEVVLFILKGDPDTVLRSLFLQAADGRLHFAPAGLSTIPVSDISALREGVEFRDYVLEGFVRYTLRATSAALGLVIEVEPVGESDTLRAQSIGWLVSRPECGGALSRIRHRPRNLP